MGAANGKVPSDKEERKAPKVKVRKVVPTPKKRKGKPRSDPAKR